MAGTPPRDETVVRLHDIVFDKVMSVLRGPEAAPFDLLNDYMDRFNAEFEQPLRLCGTVPYTTRLLIKSNRVAAGNGAVKETPPIDDVFNLYPDTSINFNGGAVSGSGSVTLDNGNAFALPTVTVGQFVRMAAVYQSANNAVDVHFSSAAAAVSGLANPGDLFSVLDGLPIGYVDLESLGVSSFASPGSSLIEDAVSGTPYIHRFASGGSGSGSGLNDFKIKSISGNNVNIGKGFQALGNGYVLVTGSGTASTDLPDNLSLNLTTILGASPAADTTYWLYVDMQNMEQPFTLTENDRPVIRINATTDFALLTTEPSATNPLRYLPIGFIHTAGDASWAGTGSRFGTEPALRQALDHRFFSFFEQASTTAVSSNASIVFSHGLSGKPQLIEFTYYDGTDEKGANNADHLVNVTTSTIEYSSLGLTFGSGQELRLKAFYFPSPGINITMPSTQPEFGWYTDTSVSSVSHNLNDALDIKGISLIEWNTVTDRYQIRPASDLVDYYTDDTIFFDWTGLSPTATLQYRLVAGGRTLPAALPTQFGGFTKFVGLGPGYYTTVAAAVADAAAGDSILVSRGYSVSGEETIDVSDLKIVFMPGAEITVTDGTVGWRVTGNRVDIQGLNMAVTKSGTLTDGLRIEGNDGNVKDTRIRTNNAGTTLTNAVNVAAGSLRAYVSASVRADAGTVTNAVVNAGSNTDVNVRG